MIKIYKFFARNLSREFFILVTIFLLALFLRLIYLSHAPLGFYTDEVVSGYVGRFILLNGKDLYGNAWPIFYFDKFGDYRTILPIYLSGVSTFIFGVNEFAVRFPPAFFGALGVIPMFLFTKQLFNRNIAFVSSFLIAILPWHIILSRAQSEGIIGLTILLFGYSILFLGLRKRRVLILSISAIILLLTYFLYPAFRLIVPLTVLPIPFFAESRKWRIISGFFVFFFIFSTIIIALTPFGAGRFEQTSFFQNKDLENSIHGINEQFAASEGEGEVLIARIFHNKITGYSWELVGQYFSYYSPNYLFVQGGLPERYDVPQMGLIYITFVVFIIFSFLPFRSNISKKSNFYLIYLLLVAPLPAVITLDDIPNIHRSLFLMIPIVLFISIQMVKFYAVLSSNRRIFITSIVLMSLMFLAEFVFYSHQYLSHTPLKNTYLRGDGTLMMVNNVIEQKGNYDDIYITSYYDTAIYYLYFANIFDGELAGRFLKNQLRVDNVDNIHFVNETCPFDNVEQNSHPRGGILIISMGDCRDLSGYKKLDEVVRKDSTVAYKFFIRNIK